MRAKFDLDTQELKGYSTLAHGINASGKTHLAGDFLKTEQANGIVRYINVSGEDGALTLKGMGLGGVAETVESYKDMEDALNEYKAANVWAIAIDSLTPLNGWVRVKTFGSDRMPNGADEWTELHRWMNNIIMLAKRSCKMLFCTCPSDRSTDQVTQKVYVTPDLPGKEARSSAGWFDYVGYVSCEATQPGKVKRVFDMSPTPGLTVRQRLPKQILAPITLPDGPGGWAAIKAAIEEGWRIKVQPVAKGAA